MTRRGFLKLFAGLLASGAALGSYAFAIEPGYRLNTTHYRLAPPGWTPGLRLRIAALADIHMGEPHMPLGRLRRIVEATNALKPDLIVLLGDYAAGHRFTTRKIPVGDTARVCAGLQCPLGAYAIMGNHDWWDDAEAQRIGHGPIVAHRAFEAAGIRALENDAVRLETDGKPFWLLGLGDQIALLPQRNGRPERANKGGHIKGVHDLAGTLNKITDDAPAILLAHEPDIFVTVPDRVSLTLAGHTHGGQVRLFGHSPVVPSRYGNRFAYGHVVEDNRHMIVSGGIGCSILPVRLGMPPEIVLLDVGA